MFEACSLSDSRACASVSDVCFSVGKLFFRSNLFKCETNFLFGGQVCTRRELSDLLSKLPWAAKHVFDRSQSKRNDARAIVDALYLRTLHDEYSVSKSEEIYVVRSILDAALLADYRDHYRGVSRGIIGHIENAYRAADARVRKFWSELDAESLNSSCDHYSDWYLKHPMFDELWPACDDAYDVYGHDDDEHNKALEVLVRFGLIDNVSDLPDRETLLRRVYAYRMFDSAGCQDGIRSGSGGRCLAPRDRRECRSKVNECAYSACNSAAYHAACVRTIIDCIIRSSLGLWINVDCDNYPKAIDHDARRHVFSSPVWCETGSLPLHWPQSAVELRPEERDHFYTWSEEAEWLRNACDHFDPSTCRTPAEDRRERRRELRNARRREVRYLRKQKATVYRREQDVATMLEAYEERWRTLQRYHLYAQKRWLLNPIDRLRARMDRAEANLQAAGEALYMLHLSLVKLNRRSQDRAC